MTTFYVPGFPLLVVEGTPAMSRGEQRVTQCAWCGTVAVVSSLAAGRTLGTCPACGHESATWWDQHGLPLAGLRVADPLEELAALTAALDEVEKRRADLVDQARAAGASWTQIGQHVGTTKQAAVKRYGAKAAGQVETGPTLLDALAGDQ